MILNLLQNSNSDNLITTQPSFQNVSPATSNPTRKALYQSGACPLI
jgi:hypothetical protein